MSDELRAAADRLSNEAYNSADHSEMHEQPLQRSRDAMLLARAYLAMHPADDAESVDVAWLLAEGWTEGKSPAGAPLWEKMIYVDEHGFGNGATRHWLRIHEPSDDWWPIEIYQQGDEQKKPDGVALRSWIGKTTRGDVRLLCRALGIPLKETK